MTPPPKTQNQNNGPVLDDWTEYKRLVLSELERLTQAVEKLKDQCTAIQTHIQTELSNLRESLTDKINNLDKEHPTHDQFTAQLAAFKKEIDELEKRFRTYTKEQQQDSMLGNKYALATAIITLVLSLIVSVVSLIVAIKG
jgi:phage host-nuclease inhibitor protein Gam